VGDTTSDVSFNSAMWLLVCTARIWRLETRYAYDVSLYMAKNITSHNVMLSLNGASPISQAGNTVYVPSFICSTMLGHVWIPCANY
jgi:hypothetical protein